MLINTDSGAISDAINRKTCIKGRTSILLHTLESLNISAAEYHRQAM